MTNAPDPAADEVAAALAAEIGWLRAFEAEHGRPLRVLHVGNVAGNAYLNAKFMRSYGIEAHVLSYDYYHPIGTPEWEDGGARPRWFVQGPIRACARYLHALLDGRRLAAAVAWRILQDAALVASAGETAAARPATRSSRRVRALDRVRNRVVLQVLRRLARVASAAASTYWAIRRRIGRIRSRIAYLRSYTWNWLMRTVFLRARSGLARLGLWPRVGAADPAGAADATSHSLSPAERIVAEFDHYFPRRRDRLTLFEAENWRYRIQAWEPLVARYDIVQGYGTDVIRPYVGGARPYVGYEHGTLRDFTLGDDMVHRMTALAYRAADHVFITNGDCLAYAEELGITAYTPMIHPLDVDRYRRGADDAEVTALRTELGADLVLLCPLRHDWEIKGTDVHLRALPAIRAANPEQSIAVVLTDWGAQVDDSRALLAELGCTDLVHWSAPLGRDDLILYMHAADVVLDQIALPHFGATAPQALAAGTPVVMSYRPESTAWIVGEPAPILSAFDPHDVATAVQTALDPEWRESFAAAAERWTRRWHHPDRIVVDHCRMYRELLDAA